MEITPRLPGVKKPLMHSENSGGKSAGLSTGCLPEFWPHPTGRQGFGNGTGLIWDRKGTVLGSGRNRDGTGNDGNYSSDSTFQSGNIFQ